MKQIKSKGEGNEEKKIPRAAAELIEFATARENDESNLSVTENRELISFLEKTIPSLSKCHLPVNFVLYPLQLHSSSPHSLSLFLGYVSLSLSLSLSLLLLFSTKNRLWSSIKREIEKKKKIRDRNGNPGWWVSKVIFYLGFAYFTLKHRFSTESTHTDHI